MGEYIIGKSIIIPTGNSGTLSMEVPVSGAIKRISIVSSGRATINDMRTEGGVDFFSGSIEVDNLHQYGNVYEFTSPLDIERGRYFSLDITNLSGAQNIISVMLEIETSK